MSSSTTQQPRLDRAYSTSSASSSDSNDGWLILNGHGSSTVTTPTNQLMHSTPTFSSLQSPVNETGILAKIGLVVFVAGLLVTWGFGRGRSCLKRRSIIILLTYGNRNYMHL
ncbi:uncharacterized protein Bfra_001040 [Botrytis fragariae]|uniref:Uncharacterized protein n=1 Tax=Botrytis fragariae TaxID=1964551 RepID=A0A8H6B466_9HELO|nr:uncharacterized protein Bfra_001040 [Botrytis fragariae]KAF5878869.1 hypothetical protein Bfra_001040 [Botrytis fragariae]